MVRYFLFLKMNYTKTDILLYIWGIPKDLISYYYNVPQGVIESG